MFSPLHLVRRLVRQPLISGSIMLGLALAVALGVAVPLATNALASLGLRATIMALPAQSQNLQLTRSTVPFDPALRHRIEQQLGDLLADHSVMSYLPLLPARRAEPLLARQVRLRAQGELAQHIVVTGRFPRAGSRREPVLELAGCTPALGIPAPLDVLVSAEQLTSSSLAVGDSFCIDGRIPATITGSFVPKNSEDAYWFGDRRPFEGERPSTPGSNELFIVLMLAEDDWNTISQRLFGNAPATHSYRGFMRGDAITLDTLDDTAHRLATVRAELSALLPHPVEAQTELDTAIWTFTTRFRLLQSALISLLLVLVSLTLIYLLLVGALAIQSQSIEIALLRSRGASTRQMLLTQFAQSLALALPGIALGVGLGALGVLVLSRTALFERLTGDSAVALRWTPATVLLPGAMLGVALFGLLVAAWPALGHSQATLRQEQARPTARLGAFRAQIEGLALLFAAAGWWQLRRGEGTIITTPDGVARFSLPALATPTLLLIAGALLFLRLFPLAVRGLGWSLSRRRGLVATLSAWQLARDPRVYSRLTLLLTLTIGLGVYSQTVTNTISRAEVRQALDEAGADVRIPLEPNDDPAALLAAIPAAAGTLLSRTEAELLVEQAGASYQQGTIALLGVDGPALSTVLALSGSDDTPLLEALRRLGSGTLLGLSLPPNAEALEIQIGGNMEGFTIFAKIAGSNGEREVAMGQSGATSTRLEAPIPSDLAPPFALQSFIVAPAVGSPSVGGQRLIFEQLATRTGTTRASLSDFERSDAWEALGSVAGDPSVSSTSGATELHVGALPTGHWAALRFRAPATLPVYLAQATDDERSAGQSLLLRIGEQRITASVQQRLGRLPGLDSRQPVLIGDRVGLAALLSYGRPALGGATAIEYNGPTTILPAELRIALRAGAAAIPMPRGITQATALLRQAADPLSNGVRVILLLGFGCALVLSVLGVLTYSALTLQARRVGWAVLGALGLRSRQLLLIVAIEHGIVLGGSLLAGLATGLLLATTTRAFLEVVTGYGGNEPISLAWQSYLPMVGGLSLTLAATLALLLVNIERRGAMRPLRLGEG